MNGAGEYVWRNVDGSLAEAGNWSGLPDEMEFLIRFAPTAPEPPHTQEEHDYMATFNGKLHEALARCRR